MQRLGVHGDDPELFSHDQVERDEAENHQLLVDLTCSDEKHTRSLMGRAGRREACTGQCTMATSECAGVRTKDFAVSLVVLEAPLEVAGERLPHHGEDEHSDHHPCRRPPINIAVENCAAHHSSPQWQELVGALPPCDCPLPTAVLPVALLACRKQPSPRRPASHYRSHTQLEHTPHLSPGAPAHTEPPARGPPGKLTSAAV